MRQTNRDKPIETNQSCRASAVSTPCSGFIKRLKIEESGKRNVWIKLCVLKSIHHLLIGPSVGLVILNVVFRLDLYKLPTCNVKRTLVTVAGFLTCVCCITVCKILTAGEQSYACFTGMFLAALPRY